MAPTPRYSVVIPTFRRPDQLAECLQSVVDFDYPLTDIEVIVVDNGGARESSEQAAAPFLGRVALRYLVNEVNRGYGFSVNRGVWAASGEVVLLLNDDARPAVGMLRGCDALLATDPRIGCVGCRAIERGYARDEIDDIGVLTSRGRVIANFDIDCGAPRDVEHVYGFCYFFTRAAIERAGLMDTVLLAAPYSSGNRIETDHCLAIRAAGLRVVYHPGLVAVHLAKPRPDMSEVSARWKINAIRNTLYLFLKHFGPFGKGGAALRLTFVDDVGILSLVRHPSISNLRYFLLGLRARFSAYWHWLKYLLSARAGSGA